MEASFQVRAELPDRPGLGQPRRPLDQQVAVGQQGDQQAFDQLRLAEHLQAKSFGQGLKSLLC